MFSATANGELLPTYVVYKAVNLMNTWTEGGAAKVRYNRTKFGWFHSVMVSQEDGSMPCDRPVNVLLYLLFYYTGS